MTLTVTDEPPDRPEWLSETIRLVAITTAEWRERLLARVARATDAELAAGSDDRWGVGQVAVHVLLIERGVAGIVLRLANGQVPGTTGQPRPGAAAVTRAGIVALAGKAEAAMATLQTSFPAVPDMQVAARHPYYGDLNAFGWLLTLPNHYRAHLDALDRGASTSL